MIREIYLTFFIVAFHSRIENINIATSQSSMENQQITTVVLKRNFQLKTNSPHEIYVYVYP